MATQSPSRVPCTSCGRDASCDLFSEISTAFMLYLDFTIHFTFGGGGVTELDLGLPITGLYVQF